MVIDSQGVPVLVAGPSAGVGKRGGVVQGMVIGGCIGGYTSALLRGADVEAGFCGGCGQALRLRIANRRGS